MEKNNINIRTARMEDAERILEIYSPYVTDTAISFEVDIPSLEEFRSRIEDVLQRYPYLVAEIEGEIVGYAYVRPFVGRKAYDWSVETSIYVDIKKKRSGIGRALYNAIESILKEMHILNLNACIGYPREEDEYLTEDSVHFHEHLGYSMVGRFHDSGYKFGRWYDMVWMEKMIGDHVDDPEPIISYQSIRDIVQEKFSIS